ncbi:uracil-DNA glycosylase [Nematocida sp. AWRm80]|nr:uracil-DNA glycosylase [Nematocida sp. AWRm80]
MSLSCSCEICLATMGLKEEWALALKPETEKEYYQEILRKLHGIQFYPKPRNIFRALSYFLPEETKVVVLGQDPYHGPDQAMGLSFSVPLGVRVPPSLINIKKEILRSTGQESVCRGGNLVPWAEQGVLLLNTILTVERKSPRSHSSYGWEKITDRIIETVSNTSKGVVFMLWGKDAQKKGGLIDPLAHLVLSSPHPSPFSANRGFLGNNHFQKANEYLKKHGKDPIKW